jgi:hypothetical protein
VSLALEQEQIHQFKPDLGRPPSVSLIMATPSDIKYQLKNPNINYYIRASKRIKNKK